MRPLFDDADNIRTGEAAEVSDRIDERDCARGRGAAEKLGRHRPEWSEGAPDSRRRNRERAQRQNRRASHRSEHQADGADPRTKCEMPPALAAQVRRTADIDHRDRRAEEWNRREHPDFEVAATAEALDNLR